MNIVDFSNYFNVMVRGFAGKRIFLRAMQRIFLSSIQSYILAMVA